jgi:hypothetical protein
MSRRNRLPDSMTLAQAAAAIGYAESTTMKMLLTQGLLRRDDDGQIVVSKDDLSFLVGTLEAKLKKNLKIKLR